MVKKFVLMAVACACVGSYTVAGFILYVIFPQQYYEL